MSKGIVNNSINNISADYIILRYIKPTSCTSCQLQMGMWKMYHKKMSKRFGKKIKIHFIIDTKNYHEAYKLSKTFNFTDNITIDTTGLFVKNNPEIKFLGNDIVMLLDSSFSVIAMGNPCKQDKIDSLYKDIISTYEK